MLVLLVRRAKRPVGHVVCRNDAFASLGPISGVDMPDLDVVSAVVTILLPSKSDWSVPSAAKTFPKSFRLCNV